MALDSTSYADFAKIYAQGLELNLRASKIIQNAWERAIHEYQALMESSMRQFAPLTKGDVPKDPMAAQAAIMEAERETIARAAQNLQKIQQESMEQLGALMQESLEMFSKLSPFMNMPRPPGKQ
jgi:polyhydroxyalkanoate synthesis regulator protein